MLWLIQEMEGCDVYKALDILARFATGEVDSTRSIAQSVKDILHRKGISLTIPTYSEVILRPWMFCVHPLPSGSRPLRRGDHGPQGGF